MKRLASIQSARAQRSIVFVMLSAFVLGIFLWPQPSRRSDGAHAATTTCPTTGNTVTLGNGQTVTPCIANAPIHMVIGYTDGTGTTSKGASSGEYQSQGLSFPNGTVSCGISCTNPKQTQFTLADGTTTSNIGDGASDLLLVRLKGLSVMKDAYMTVVPQSSPTAPTVAGTGEYKLQFAPTNQSSANWTIGASCANTDIWARNDTHVKINVLTGINLNLDSVATNSLLGSIATLQLPGGEFLGWVYYINANSSGSCTAPNFNLADTTITTVG